MIETLNKPVNDYITNQEDNKPVNDYIANQEDSKPVNDYIANQDNKLIECQVQVDDTIISPSPSSSTFSSYDATKSKIYDCIMDVTSLCLTVPLLSFFTVNALFYTIKKRWKQRDYFMNRPRSSTSTCTSTSIDNDDLTNEYITRDETYYAKRWGYDCQQCEITTKDGYVLKMYRFSSSKINSENKKPVLIGHGLFQCSGAFVLNEKKSLAFALVDEGYDVWTGNNRAVGSLGHTHLSSNETKYWEWGLKELGLYDLPTMLDHIRSTTGYNTVAYIGHSQGNAQGFVALNLQPELANKLSCFIALAPAVISGPLVTTFPLRSLIQLDDRSFRIIFGSKSFLGMMTQVQNYLPPKMMSHLAYSMFAYLFEWWDENWIKRRKVKYFQFTPRTVSSQLLLDWIEGWGQRGICKYVDIESHASASSIPETITTSAYIRKTPLTIIYGTNDYLVDGAAFVRSFKRYEQHGIIINEEEEEEDEINETTPIHNTTVAATGRYQFSFPTLELIHVERIEGYEHMDTIWAADNHITTYPIIFKALDNGLWAQQ
ncbi:Alpha/Beta hydrolase protein [Cunninghamella echinulata]|nr:Alpha/Beta hydrolase protein [Cunninghamella echinulata]